MKTRTKKRMLALGAALLMLAACTDDNPAPATDDYIGKKLARLYTVMYDTPEGDYQPILRGTTEFGWDGERLAYMGARGDYRLNFVYEDDRIVRVEENPYDGASYTEQEITYTNGRVSTKKHYRYDGHLRCTQDFIYGNDGLLQKIISVGDVFSESGNHEETRTLTLSWNNGNIVCVEIVHNSPRSGVSTWVRTYEYDNAPNPTRPMALVLLDCYCEDIEKFSRNNVMSEKSEGKENRLVWTYDDGYPAKSIKYFHDAPENVHLDNYYEYTDGTGARPE